MSLSQPAAPEGVNPHLVTRGSHPRKTAFHRKNGGVSMGVLNGEMGLGG